MFDQLPEKLVYLEKLQMCLQAADYHPLLPVVQM